MRNATIPKAKAIIDPIETCDIAHELEKLAICSQVFSKRTVDACNQAAYLLKRMRLVTFTQSISDGEKVALINEMLAKQGDG